MCNATPMRSLLLSRSVFFHQQFPSFRLHSFLVLLTRSLFHHFTFRRLPATVRRFVSPSVRWHTKRFGSINFKVNPLLIYSWHTHRHPRGSAHRTRNKVYLYRTIHSTLLPNGTRFTHLKKFFLAKWWRNVLYAIYITRWLGARGQEK